MAIEVADRRRPDPANVHSGSSSGAGGRRSVLRQPGCLARDSLRTNDDPAAGAPRSRTFNLQRRRVDRQLHGRSKIAHTVNGRCPRRCCGGRKGDTVTVRVTNTLDEAASIHWHGIVLPANMDGVPGLSFDGIAGRDLRYRSPSGRRAPTGITATRASRTAGALRADRHRSARSGAVRYDREHVVMLTDWTDEDPARVFAS